MNKEQHGGIGLAGFILYYYFFGLFIKSSDINLLYGLLAILLGSTLPDILEPATNWMHRGEYHSKRALKLTAKAFGVTTVIGLLGSFYNPFLIFYAISNLFLGYALHLLADSLTTVGLPD